ncbi:MAG: hypothetical protein LC798_13060 [Chloroflexi bacterium]|nr:hypothetical protein [Chloroflexota bacterium]
MAERENLARSVKRFLDVWWEFDGPPLTPADTYEVVSESVQDLQAAFDAHPSASGGEGLQLSREEARAISRLLDGWIDEREAHAVKAVIRRLMDEITFQDDRDEAAGGEEWTPEQRQVLVALVRAVLAELSATLTFLASQGGEGEDRG